MEGFGVKWQNRTVAVAVGVFGLSLAIAMGGKFVGYYLITTAYEGVSASVKTTNPFWILPDHAMAMYSNIIFSYDYDAYAQIGYNKENSRRKNKIRYFYEWSDGYGHFGRDDWSPGPNPGSYHTYKVLNDAGDSYNNRYYFYVDSTCKTTADIIIPPMELNPWVETHFCSTGFGKAHFKYIQYYDPNLCPDPWRYWSTHSEKKDCGYKITVISHYEYKAKK